MDASVSSNWGADPRNVRLAAAPKSAPCAPESNGLRAEMNDRIDGLRAEMNKLRERVARIEGLLEAVFMRRDLTPVPEPPLPEPPGKSEAA